ncbi:21473_t:CDS:2, partial [Dentiscutata erythropus]
CNPSIGPSFSVFISSIGTQLTQSVINNKILTIAAGQFPPVNMIFAAISFVNIQAFSLNIDTGNVSAGIEQIKAIRNSWNSTGLDDSKLVLVVEFGGIVEIVSSNNIESDINNQQLHPVNVSISNSILPNYEPISDQCKNSTYGYLPWTNLNYQSLYTKIDFVNSNGLAGIAIADITKDSNDLRLTNFILGNIPPLTTYNGTLPNNASSIPTSPTPGSSSNTSAIVGGVIGSFAFAATVAAAGFMLYRKRRAKMSNLFIDTNNQTCSDTNHTNNETNTKNANDLTCHYTLKTKVAVLNFDKWQWLKVLHRLKNAIGA